MLKAVLNQADNELIDGAKDEPVLPGRAAIGISARARQTSSHLKKPGAVSGERIVSWRRFCHHSRRRSK